MKRVQGLRTTTAMLAAGMLAATLVTGCAGGGGQRQTETEAEQDGTTEAAAADNAAGGESATLLAGLDGEVISGTGERTTLTEIAAGRPQKLEHADIRFIADIPTLEMCNLESKVTDKDLTPLIKLKCCDSKEILTVERRAQNRRYLVANGYINTWYDRRKT